MLEQVGKVIFKYMYSNHKTTEVLKVMNTPIEFVG